MKSRCCWFCVLVLLGGLVLTDFSPAPAVQEPAPRPRLAVLVIFDQMRADYLTRWQKHFRKDGLGRLLREAAWFQNCHYPYAYTLTAPGHASLVTGCCPHKHGIIANTWYDRASGDLTDAGRTDRYQPVPPPPGRRVSGSAPIRLHSPTAGAELLGGIDGKGRVVSLSIKDRAAIFLAALRGAICSWFSTSTGQFVTSTYYTDRLPAWVSDFNRGRPADKWFGRSWDRFRPDLDYDRLAGPDDVAAEGIGFKQGRTFPHLLTGGKDKITRAYYEALTLSPFGNELLLELARRAINAEKLGQRDAPDLLCISFSSNDLVGHTWGPDSQEVFDITLRSDWIIQQLLDHLDARVGKGKYLLMVSADHGVSPLPELARARGEDAGRVPPELLTSRAEAFLNETFNPGKPRLPFIEAAASEMVYLNLETLKEEKLAPAKVETALAAWLVRQPGVKAAYTRSQLGGGPIKDDPLAESVRLSFDAERSGDVMVLLKPNYMLSPPITSPKLDAYRTTHGSPYPCDTHVPLLVYGPGIRPGVREERVTPLAVAAILARGLGVRPPRDAEVGVPPSLFGGR
jgi:hypothetical protein